MSMPFTVKTTARVTVDPPADIVMVALYVFACSPVGFALTVIVTLGPPAVMVLLLGETESQGALLLVEMLMVAEPLPVAVRCVEESLTGLVVPAFAEGSTSF
jgi:hypothetical protein